MRLRSQLILIGALLAGAVLSFALRAALKPSATPVTSGNAANEPMEPVMVAKSDLSVGEELTAQNIRFQLYPENKAPWDAIRRFQDVTGRALVRPVKGGSLISLYDLNDPDSRAADSTLFIPPGCQPVVIQIDALTESGKFPDDIQKLVFPRDQAVISAVFEEKEAETTGEGGKPRQRKLVTKPLIQNAIVYRVASQQRITDNLGTLQRQATVEFLLNDQQIASLKGAADQGNLLVTIVRPKSRGDGAEGKEIQLEGRPIASPEAPIAAPIAAPISEPIAETPAPAPESPRELDSRGAPNPIPAVLPTTPTPSLPPSIHVENQTASFTESVETAASEPSDLSRTATTLNEENKNADFGSDASIDVVSTETGSAGKPSNANPNATPDANANLDANAVADFAPTESVLPPAEDPYSQMKVRRPVAKPTPVKSSAQPATGEGNENKEGAITPIKTITVSRPIHSSASEIYPPVRTPRKPAEPSAIPSEGNLVSGETL